MAFLFPLILLAFPCTSSNLNSSFSDISGKNWGFTKLLLNGIDFFALSQKYFWLLVFKFYILIAAYTSLWFTHTFQSFSPTPGMCIPIQTDLD